MNGTDYLIIALALLIGVAYLWKIWSYDIYEKEPFLKLLAVSVVGGILSVVISLFLYRFVDVKLNIVDAIIKIGVIEESAKLISLVIIYHFIKKEFNEIVDGIIYITAISLGFAIIENILYCFNSEIPFALLLQRSLFSVLGHISFSVYMGIAFYVHKKIKKNYAGLLLSFCIAILAHGLYDGVLFHSELNSIFIYFFGLLVITQFWLLRTAMGFSEFRKRLSPEIFIPDDQTLFLKCSKCDTSIKPKAILFWKIKVGICDECSNYVLNEENTEKLFQYFRPIRTYKKFIKDLPTDEKVIFLDESNKVYFDTKRKFLSANVNDLSLWLEESNKKDQKNAFYFFFIGFFFKHIGLKYM